VAITRHREMVGYHIPARRKRAVAERAALKEAASRPQQTLAAQGMSEGDVLKDKRLRRGDWKGAGKCHRLKSVTVCYDMSHGGIFDMCSEARLRVNENGRVVIPASFRKALGINVGDEVVLRIEDDELRITTLKHRIERAQRLVRQHVKPGTSLVDELIAERRDAARHE
jgi:AbrB family looped-hinge helix DNA binding protein